MSTAIHELPRGTTYLLTASGWTAWAHSKQEVLATIWAVRKWGEITVLARVEDRKSWLVCRVTSRSVEHTGQYKRRAFT